MGDVSSSGSMDAIHRGQLGTQVAQLLNLPPVEIQTLMNRAARRRSKGMQGDATAADSVAAGAFLQDAWSILLGVLLNEPGHCASVQLNLDSSQIRDDRDRHIAEIVFSLAETLGEFTIKDVIGACGEDPAVAVRIAELAERGEKRGNYAATVEGASDRIHRGSELRCAESAKKDWRGADDPEQIRSQYARISELSKEHRGFVPKRRMTGSREAARKTEPSARPEESVPTETK